jgi:hypothetical protein
VNLRVELRSDLRVGDDEQLLLRMNDDQDEVNVLRLALANAPAYRGIHGYEAAGAVALSCFAVASALDAEILIRGTRWSALGTRYGLATVGAVRALGCQVLPTVVYERGVRLPLSDRHVDVIASPYPAAFADYATLTKSQRAEVRALTQARFSDVVRAFDPRHQVEGA